LEVSERPSKRHEPDIGTLTLSSKEPIEDVSKKLLFRRVETISPSGEKGVPLYESLLLKVNNKKHVWENRKKQQESWKSKEKQEHLLAAAKEQHGVPLLCLLLPFTGMFLMIPVVCFVLHLCVSFGPEVAI
jgi:hypothetical protein